MRTLASPRASVLTSYLILPAMALAHPGHHHPGEEDEFDALAAGFMHPISGLDHVLLALTVGWLAFSWFRGCALVSSLLTFATMIGIGTLAGVHLHSSLLQNLALAVALLIAGASWMTKQQPSFKQFLGGIAVFGMLIGISHDSSSIAGAWLLLPALGGFLGTAVLVAVGGLLRRMIAPFRLSFISQVTGAVMFCLGSYSLVQIY